MCTVHLGLSRVLQAFSLPVLQVVYETVRDRQEGKLTRSAAGMGVGMPLGASSVLVTHTHIHTHTHHKYEVLVSVLADSGVKRLALNAYDRDQFLGKI